MGAGRPLQSFYLQKTPWGLNINNFCENWHDASFYIKEQTQENKFEIRVLKTTIFGPPKKRVFGFLRKKPQNLVFFVFRL